MSKTAPLLIRISRGILTLTLPVLLITGSVRLVMTPLWMTLEYTRSGFPADSYGFSTDNRLSYGRYSIEYLLNSEAIDFLGSLRLDAALCFNPPHGAADCALFNPDELNHMQDVKTVTQIVFLVSLICAALALVAGCILWKTAHRNYYLALLQGSILTLSVIATVVVIAVTAWNFFFDTFHALFFQSGTWRFYFSDSLIRLYPEQFWFDAALTVGTLATLAALAMAGITWRRLNRGMAQS